MPPVLTAAASWVKVHDAAVPVPTTVVGLEVSTGVPCAGIPAVHEPFGLPAMVGTPLSPPPEELPLLEPELDPELLLEPLLEPLPEPPPAAPPVPASRIDRCSLVARVGPRTRRRLHRPASTTQSEAWSGVLIPHCAPHFMRWHSYTDVRGMPRVAPI